MCSLSFLSCSNSFLVLSRQLEFAPIACFMIIMSSLLRHQNCGKKWYKFWLLNNINARSSAPSTCSYEFFATMTTTLLLLWLSLHFLTVNSPWFFRIRHLWEFRTWGAEGRFVIVYIFVCVDNYPEINDAYLSFLSLFLLHLLHNAVRGAFLYFLYILKLSWPPWGSRQ